MDEEIIQRELECYENIEHLLVTLRNKISYECIEQHVQQLQYEMEKIKKIVIWRHKNAQKIDEKNMEKIRDIQDVLKEVKFLHENQKQMCNKMIAIITPGNCSYNKNGTTNKGLTYGKSINYRG
ncbi:hypothetical protein [Candidatus Uabimicrobium amorphum]|uniref:Uncharacterized protein n=1 Tax=Uabimicrobium amorphum TaxID=2596890 RepID=A0A5S9IPB6_UABAM|nr:hypothetical protein [Candidatus Uabimicrobium amorphum]BBM84982.1 hypothetical protein UABAM_03345 [Candidatus Uabimicrobium amorphum]